jgi:hypothetical protein
MTQKKMPDFISGLGDSGRATADLAVIAIGKDAENFKHLLNICFSEAYPICMRASRVVQLFCEKNPEFIVPYLDEIIDKISCSKEEGVKREFLKIIAECIDFNLVKDNSTLLDIAFNWMSSTKEAVAIRYYCINICEKFCVCEPDLKSEFKILLEFSLNDATPGFRNRALKVLKKL